MKRGLILLAALVFVLTGCGGGRFHLPKKDYQARVKTIGVTPILVDVGSFSHPAAGRLVEMLQRHNRGRHAVLVDRLRAKDRYFDIRQVDGQSESLASRLLAESRLVRGGELVYRDYDFQPATVGALCSDNLVDGLLVIVMSEIERVETRRDRIPVNYLKAPYRSVQVRAFVVLSDGKVAWSYPADGSRPFVELQYPDFDEAYYNRTDRVRVKDISLEGVERTILEGEGTDGLPDSYADLFDDIINGLTPLLDGVL